MSNERKTLTSEEVADAEKAQKEKADKAAELAAADRATTAKGAEKKKATQEANTTKSPAGKLAEKYCKAYPDNKVFYVTSDMQVFLQSDHNMALMHQKTLKDGELETIKF